MEQSPLEQAKNNQVNLERENVRKSIKKLLEGTLEGTAEERGRRLDKFISELGIYEECGVVFDKEKTEKEVTEIMNLENTEDKSALVARLMKVLDPLIVAKITLPEISRKIKLKETQERRDGILNEHGNIKLSKILYAGLSEKSAHIHLADAYDFMTKEKIADFDSEIKNGLRNLAKLIEPMKNIEKITATSWIVAKSPKRLERLGFTIEGDISEEERNKHFADDTRVIHKAYIDRKKFDELYLGKNP